MEDYEDYKNTQITVFTPTYNRAYRLSALYESLRKQTCKDFEWLVIDDGSTDGTSKLFETWKEETTFSVRYLHQKNGGKHRAINKGVLEAKGELFFIVDSDDYLLPDAIEWIIKNSSDIINNEKFAGICGLKVYEDGRKVGGGTDFDQIDANALDIRFKHHVTGDLAEVFKTKILRQFPFPEIDGEKFCTEALVWNRIAQQYQLRYIYKSIYVCEYLDGGLSNGSICIRRKAPIASTRFYAELFCYDIPFVQKVKAAINLWRFTPVRSICASIKAMKGNLIWSILVLPMGIMYSWLDTFSLKR